MGELYKIKRDEERGDRLERSLRFLLESRQTLRKLPRMPFGRHVL
jgi:hypothetical protein